MKKLLSVLMVLTTVFTSSVFANDVKVQYNFEEVVFENQGAVIIENRTLIPLRGVFDKMGYEITWEPNTKTATFTKGETVIEVTANTSIYKVNGEEKTMDVWAQIINSSMLVPLRAIGEATGATVDWQAETKTAIINEKVTTKDGFSLEIVGSGYEI